MRTSQKGFTRVDLAVTLLCAAFLIMTMGAVGNRGRRRAQQLVCASQLGKWGQAIFMHSADNDEMVMSMIRRWGDMPFPHYIAALPLRLYGTDLPEYMREGEFSIYLIDPYLDCIGDDFENNGQGTRLLACPSTNSDFIIQWCWACWDAFCRPPHPSGSIGEYFIEPSYSYWNAGGPVPLEVGDECSANAVEDLTFDTLSPDRLLMSDILTIDGSWGALRYNHGLTGWAWGMDWASSAPAPGHDKFDGEQDATGRNQLFGDGRVQWRPISLEFEDNLPSQYVEGFYENEWNGACSGWVNQYDVSYY